MQNEYIWCLWKQFCETKGISMSSDINYLYNDFINWTKERKSLLYDYRYYLEVLGIDIEDNDSLEINKGKYDSLYERGVNIASIYGETMKKEKKVFMIDRSFPVLLTKNGLEIPKEKLLFTYNPYFDSEITSWYKIHNKKEKDISIGMFGNINDENAKRKILLLKEISNYMTNDYTYSFDTFNDNYFCSLNSKIYTKSKY